MQRYVEAQCCIASNDYKGKIVTFQTYASNVYMLIYAYLPANTTSCRRGFLLLVS